MMQKIYMRLFMYFLLKIVPDAKYCDCLWCKKVRDFIDEVKEYYVISQ